MDENLLAIYQNRLDRSAYEYLRTISYRMPNPVDYLE
jgi:hypothetical protein